MAGHTRTPRLHRQHKRLLLFAAFLAYLYFRGIGDHGLIDPLEGVNASIGIDMLVTGRYFTPHVGEQAAAGRALGTWWLSALSVNVLGWEELAVRFWSALAGLLTALAAALALRPSDRSSLGRWLAAALAASTTLTFAVSHLASPHALYACCTSLALVGFLRADEGGRWTLLPGLAPLAGLLCYGLEGVILPWAAFLVFVAMTGRFDRLKAPAPALMVSILGTGGYLTLLGAKNPALLLFLRCEVPKLLESGWGLWMLTLAGGFLPWLGVMALALWDAVPRSKESLQGAGDELLMALWALTFFLGALLTGDLLALAACVPPLAALAGSALAQWWEEGRTERVLQAVALNILVLVPVAGLGIPLAVRAFPLLREALFSLVPWGACLALLALVSWHYARTRQFAKLARNVLALALLCLLPLAGAFDLAAGVSLRRIGPELKGPMDKGGVAAQYGAHYPSLYFYTLHSYALVDGPLLPGLDSRRFMMDDTALHLLWEGRDRAFLVIPQSRQPRSPLPQNVYSLMEEDGLLLLSNEPD